MEMPRITDNHRKLEKLVGSWEGGETMHPSPWDPNGGVAQGRRKARLALDGFAVIADYEQRRDGRVVYSGHGVYGYDPQEACYTLHWFDSIGTGAELFKGNFEDGVLTLTSRGPQGYARNIADCSFEGRIRAKLEMSPDGERWTPLFEGEYRRK